MAVSCIALQLFIKKCPVYARTVWLPPAPSPLQTGVPQFVGQRDGRPLLQNHTCSSSRHQSRFEACSRWGNDHPDPWMLYQRGMRAQCSRGR
jgi:hypothetical protein